MKKFYLVAAAMLLSASVSHAQATGGSTDQLKPGVTKNGAITGHKGGTVGGKKVMAMDVSGKKPITNASGKKATITNPVITNASGKKGTKLSPAQAAKNKKGSGGSTTPPPK